MTEQKREVVTIRARPGSTACPVIIGPGLLEKADFLDRVGPGKVFLVSDRRVFPLYGAALARRLEASGRKTATVCLPAGERVKSLYYLRRLYLAARDAGLERSSTVLALGGGVITDLAGFFAATWLRGLPLFNLPTTLLGQVDAALGGKNGVNFEGLKNQAGTFYHPRLVVCDTAALATLPPREYRGGMAEVIKCGIIRDRQLFEFLAAHAGGLKRRERAALAHAVVSAVKVKAAVVSADAAESRGVREVLNYGHTIGHGLEAVSSGRRLSHGEAVAVGMAVEAEIACLMGMLDRAVQQEIVRLIGKAGLPTTVSGIDAGSVREAMFFDKKKKAGRTVFVLPSEIGSTFVRNDVPEELVTAALAGYLR